MTENAPATSDTQFVTISSDGFSATARFDRALGAAPPTEEDIVRELVDARVHLTELIRDRVQDFLGRVHDGNRPVEPMVLAEGVRPVHGEPEHLVWAEGFRTAAEEWRGAMPERAYPISALARVEEGQTIGRIEPPREPRDGRNLTGALVLAQGRSGCLQLDHTIRRSPTDASTLIASVAGRIVQDGFDLTVAPVLSIAGDVGRETGTVTAESSLWVEGRITEGAIVRTEDPILVHGSIEGARVDAKDSIYVRQGIKGRRRGVVRAAGDISAKSAAETLLVAAQDVYLGTDLQRCQTCVSGRLIGPTLHLTGGTTVVRGRAELGTLGTTDGTPTQVAIGVGASSVYELACVNHRIRNMRDMVVRLQRIIGPLLIDRSSLSTDQQRRLRSLLARIAHAEKEIDRGQRRCSELVEEVFSTDAEFISVTRRIHPNTTISIADRLTVIKGGIAGPVRIELRRLDGAIEMVLVNSAGAIVKKLPSERVGVEEVIGGFDVASYGLA